MWGDDRFSRLSKPQPNGQTLWIYLLTGPHTTTLPTAFVAGEAGLAEALSWSLPAFRKAFNEVLAEGLIEADMRNRLVFIPKAVRHNPPQSPNVVIAWRKAFDELPDCVLKQRIFDHTLAELAFIGKGETFREAFGEVFRYAFAESEQNNTNTSNRTEPMGRRPAKHPMPPPDFLPITAEMANFATSLGVCDIQRETEAMLDHFRGKGESRADWVATWRTWIRNSKRFGDRNGTHKSKTDRNRENAEKLLSRFDFEDGGSGVG